jgi:hypothetical protein
MPVVVTDDDVLAQIALDDAAAAVVAGQIKTMGASVPPQTAGAWASDLASYQGWATEAKKRLSGGFVFGEWFGVAADGDAAMAWAHTIAGYQSILASVAAGKTPPDLIPPRPSVGGVGDANAGGVVSGATGAIASVSSSVASPLKWIAIAAVAGAAAFLAFERRR